MSPAQPEPEFVEATEVTEPADPTREDGSLVLSQHDLFKLLVNDPGVRNYIIAAFSALVMIFLVMFQQASDLGGLLIVAIGAGGILLRWTPAPAIVLILLTYFMVFPLGIPGWSSESAWEIEQGRFRPTDLVLTMAVLVYMAAQFRIFSFVHQIITPEGTVRRHDEPVTRRPPALIASSEIGTLLLVSFVLVIVAQIIWWVVNSLEVTPTEDFPLRWLASTRGPRRSVESGGLTPGLTRFVVLIGLIGFSVLLGRLIFGYWRLRTMQPAEGAMILLDDGWLETKRERSRQEKWRLWGQQQAKARAAEAAEKAKQGGKR